MNELRDSNPLDLGEVTVNLRTILQPGDRVPELDVETTGGKRVKLADFRGKVVLLDFWATWCGPCVAKMPKLKALYKKLRGGGKFEIIGLSLDRSVEAAKGFAERENLTWVQCYLGEWTKTPIPERYAVSSIPAFFLVGPDGRLLAKGFRLETIQEELEKAVSKLSSTKSVSERPVSNDPYSVLTEKVRLDWTAAMAAIQDNEEERFKAYLMSSHLTSGLFDAFRTAAGLLPDVDSRLAAIFYTYPDKPAGIRDACIVAGPFQVKTGSEVVYSLGERSETFPIRPDKPYYVYVELTNEGDDADELVLPIYRVKSPIMPLGFQESVKRITGTYSRWKNECHIQPFSEDGVRIRDAILSIWSGN